MLRRRSAHQPHLASWHFASCQDVLGGVVVAVQTEPAALVRDLVPPDHERFPHLAPTPLNTSGYCRQAPGFWPLFACSVVDPAAEQQGPRSSSTHSYVGVGLRFSALPMPCLYPAVPCLLC